MAVHRRALRAVVLASMFGAQSAFATDFPGVMPAALDQPRINAMLSRGPIGPNQPLTADFGTGPVFNITAFYDTGASGVLLSEDTADALGVTRQQVAGNNAVFTDVGVGGSSAYNISEELYIGLARFHPDADVDNLKTFSTVYNQTFGNIRGQIGPINIINPDPNLAGLDVFGMPTMNNKVVVMDPKPVNTFVDTMRTYAYPPGTPYNAALADSDPGIPVLNNPATDRHITLSYGDFDRFTTTTPGAAPPSLRHNPFIGPNPVLQLEPNPPPDTTPPIKIGYGSQSTEGSFLLDTGAAASIISNETAAGVGVSYVPGTYGTSNPILQGVPADEQFQLTIGGTGGTTKIAGFFLDSMLVRTDEGNPANDNDPNHLRFIGAPVLVYDISVMDPVTSQSLTLDGIFGMNYLIASAFVTEAEPFPIIDNLTFSNFDWAVFDEPAGKLGLRIAADDPQDGLSWFGAIFEDNDWDIDNNANWIGQQSLVVYQDGDRVRFTDLTVDPDVHLTDVVAPGGVTFDNTDEADYSLYGSGRITGFTGLIKKNTGLVNIETANDYTGVTDVLSGTIVFSAEQDIGPVNVRAAGAVTMATSQRFQAINIDAGYAVLDGTAHLLRVHTIEIINNGRLNLGSNDMIVSVTPLSEVETLIKGARAGGTWTGGGITSSAAQSQASHATTLGAMTGQQFHAANNNATLFNGIAVADTDTLVKYTWYGDSDFNGLVDFDDYARIDLGFNTNQSGWASGDSDMNGIVDFDDYALIDLAFNTQNGTLIDALNWLEGEDRSMSNRSTGVSTVIAHYEQFGMEYVNAFYASVPEPGAISLVAIGALALRRRACRN